MKFDEFKSVDFVPTLNEAFVDLVTIIIGGVKHPEDMEKLDGERPVVAVEQFFFDMLHSGRNPLNLLTLGLAHKLGLLKTSRRGKRRIQLVEDYIWNMIKERKAEWECTHTGIGFSGERDINMIDLMVEYNKKMEAEGKKEEMLEREEMVEAVVTFYLAGSDTSRAASTSFLYLLSTMEGVQSKVYQEIKDVFFEGDVEFLKNLKIRKNH